MEVLVGVLAGLYGTILGSFGGALIYRLHHAEKNMLRGRSKCPHCKKQLSWKDLFPIFSWIFSKGLCRYCHKKISLRYPLIEIVFGLSFFLFSTHFYADLTQMILMLVFVFLLLLLFFYDLWYLEVDDRIVFPAILLAFVWTFFRDLPPTHYLIGGGLGAAFYFGQYFFSKGKWVGFGDVYFGLLIGLLLGWKWLFLSFFLAYIVGCLCAVYLIILKDYHRKSPLPMGAFLIPSCLIFLYEGEKIWDAYWRFILNL